MKHFTLSLIIVFCLLMSADLHSTTKTWVGGQDNSWNTPENWLPKSGSAPAQGDTVIISSNAVITGVPTISLSALLLNGSISLTSGNTDITITVTGSLNINSGSVVTMIPGKKKSFLLNLSANATGTIYGTLVLYMNLNNFNCYGNLKMSRDGVINGSGSFVLYPGAVLQIGSVDGITSGTTASGNIQVTGTRTFNVGANYVYNGTSNQNTGNGLPSNLSGSLTIDNQGNTVALSSSDTIANGGTVNLNNGTFAAGTNLTMTSTSTINRSEGIVTGTLQGAGTYNVNYSGNAKSTGQELSGSGNLNNITINMNSGQDVTLMMSKTVDGTLTMLSGKLNISSPKLLTLSNSASASGGSALSFVNGPMIKNTNSINPFTFPVGKGGTYMPIGITPVSTVQSSFRAEYNNNPYKNTTSFSGGITRVSTIDYYDLSRTAGDANVYVTVYWNASSGVTEADMQSLKVAHWNGSLWENLGGNNITGSASYGNVTTTSAVGSFSPFALGSTGDSPLPVSLASLTSSTTGRNVNLKWTTISEINNSGFDVERKGFSGDYVKVGHMQGKGTVSTPSSYEFTDRNLASGKYSYRLKQIDNNGNFEYYSLNGDVVVGVPSKFDLSQNYPNPFNPSTKINFDMPKDGLVSLKIYDMLGREVSTLVSEFRTAGYYSVDFNASSLTSGVYFYRVSTGDFSAVKKMTVLK
jgi:hypothetical protein